MSFSELRQLFETLCDHLEADTPNILHFQGAYGIELPLGVVMIFVFQEALLVCRFSADLSREEYLEEEFDEDELEDDFPALQLDECIEMQSFLQNWKGGFQELFQ